MTENLSMLVDLYEMTMSNGLFDTGKEETTAYFDLFFRRVPDDGGFAIMAGLEQMTEYLQNLRFSEDEVAYLRGLNKFDERFLQLLARFKFTCDVWAVPEGTPIFPGEPIVTVRGPVIQAMLVETMLLLTINHQSLIATKACRIARAAQGHTVTEFGARRAHSYDAAVYGARAAYIGGADSTSNLKAAESFGIPPAGTMAHSWVQLFDDELTAFKAYAAKYPSQCVLLVDTYNTLKSGVPNAIKAFDEVVVPAGCRPMGIRIDSGDITYLSKKARKMLDDAGYPDCHIFVSNSLDEYLIRDMLMQGAKVDNFCVGERLITASSEAVFGGVYKLVATEQDGVITPKIKISENVSKITLPGFKTCWRLFDRESGKAIADVITLANERIDDTQPYEIFDPEYTWKRKTVRDFIARRLLVPVFDAGQLVYESPSAQSIKRYCKGQVETLWEEVQRFEKPHKYYVDYSEKLWNLRRGLLSEKTV
ncbi:MAG: nicotinate phosphoribosyltransferase [Candidatus Howiella sp.]|jgi:nicotinate phosphoribosyltransferase